MGGFEGACFEFFDGRVVDCIAATRHDDHCNTDYRALRDAGLRTARDAFRWPLIEREPRRYDWSSIAPMLEAAKAQRIQVIWDLCHFGIPAHVDAASPDFPVRFAEYAWHAAKLARDITGAPGWWCPINEISYWCHAAGAMGYMAPAMPGRADFFKRQLVRAYLAAREAVLAADPGARFVAIDPLVNITEITGRQCAAENAWGFQAWDMLLGKGADALGHGAAVDVIGVNYYSDNQRLLNGWLLGMGQRGYRPLRYLLQDVWMRYGKPILISETGAEHPNGANWFSYIETEVATARAMGVPVAGICVYPIMDYPGWTDSRHCRCGIIELDAQYERRAVRQVDVAQLKKAASDLPMGCDGPDQVDRRSVRLGTKLHDIYATR